MGLDDKFENKKDQVVGKGKEAVGDVTGDEKLETEGNVDQMKGHLGEAGENIKDSLGKAGDKVKDIFSKDN